MEGKGASTRGLRRSCPRALPPAPGWRSSDQADVVLPAPAYAASASGARTPAWPRDARFGHDLGAIARADLGGVLAVSGVADVVQGLDAPVTAHPPGELGRGGLGDGAP